MRPKYNAVQGRMSTWELVKRGYQRGGFVFTVRSALKVALTILRRNVTYLWLILRPARTFTIAGYRYAYFIHKYNTTWHNERCVEVPVVRHVLQQYAGRRTLEVGQVLGHYAPTTHAVLDKYESGPGVIGEDAAMYRPNEGYDLIVSISTLEHVGYDETPADPGKISRAVHNLFHNCLAPGGELVFTVPLGYNPTLDRLLNERQLPLSQMICLKRIGPRAWREASWDEVRGTAFDFDGQTADAIVVGHLHKPAVSGVAPL